MAQAFLVNAVTNAFREMPLHPDAKRGKSARCLEHRLWWDEIVTVAMHEQNRRARLDLGREGFRLEVGRDNQEP